MITNTKLDPIETASVDELQALQTQRLKWTLKHAYENVPMYRRKFDAAGVHPDDFRELSDLRKFPCTTKQDLRDNYPFGLSAVPLEEVVRLHSSSGTTGTPTVILHTQHDLDEWANAVARCLYMVGLSKGDIFQNSSGYGMFLACGRWHAQRQNSCCLWLRPVYWWAGCALWCRTSGRYGDPDVWRADGKTSATDP